MGRRRRHRSRHHEHRRGAPSATESRARSPIRRGAGSSRRSSPSTRPARVVVGREGAGPAPHRRAEHHLLGQAPHRPPVGLAGGRAGARATLPFELREGPQRRGRRGGPRRDVLAARDQRVRAPPGARRWPRPRWASPSSAPSSPCPRTSTTCSARRRRSPGASPGSRCCASSTSRRPPRSRTGRPGKQRRAGRRVRPRRRHVRRHHPRSGGQRLRGARHGGRHGARRRRHRRRASPSGWPTTCSRGTASTRARSRMVFARLRILAEGMKRALSSRDEHTLTVDDLVPGERGAPVAWSFRMTRPELEWASAGARRAHVQGVPAGARAAGAGAADLDRVILVGGATRMPMVARKVGAVLRARAGRAHQPGRGRGARRGHPGGAARPYATARRRARWRHPRISEDSVVQELPGGGGLREREDLRRFRSSEVPRRRPGAVPRRAPRPLLRPPARPRAEGAGQFLPGASSDGARLRRAREPPLPVPDLAARAAADWPGPPRRSAISPAAPAAPARRAPPPAPLLIDVTPLSLGVETVGGFCDILIEANTPVPCDRTRTFTTASTSRQVQVRVSQGAERRFAENTCLGELELSGLPPAGAVRRRSPSPSRSTPTGSSTCARAT